MRWLRRGAGVGTGASLVRAGNGEQGTREGADPGRAEEAKPNHEGSKGKKDLEVAEGVRRRGGGATDGRG